METTTLEPTSPRIPITHNDPQHPTGLKRLSTTAIIGTNALAKLTSSGDPITIPAADGKTSIEHQQTVDFEEDVDDESSIERNTPRWFFNFICSIYKVFCPDHMPMAMGLVILVVVCLLGFEKASHGFQPAFIFYSVYFGISIGILITWLIIRVVWIYILSKLLLLPASKLTAAIASILDPEIFYMAFTVSLYIFWNNAISESETIINPNPHTNSGSVTRIELTILGLDILRVKAESTDLLTLERTIIFLILWTVRNVVVSVVMFYFLMGFLMNVNSQVVRYLTQYSLLRKLNANWIRLTPAREELEVGIENDGEDDANFPPFNPILSAQFGGLNNNPHFSPSGKDNVDGESQQQQQQIARSLSRAGSSAVQQALHELREVSTKEKEISKALGDIDHTVNRLLSTKLVHRPDRLLKQKYRVEHTGGNLPSFLTRQNILRTEISSIQNLLAIEFIRSNPAVIFAGDVYVELESKRVARLAAKQLFDELIEFRNRVAPAEEDLTSAELDVHVKQSLAQTISVSCQRQASKFLVPQPSLREGQIGSFTAADNKPPSSQDEVIAKLLKPDPSSKNTVPSRHISPSQSFAKSPNGLPYHINISHPDSNNGGSDNTKNYAQAKDTSDPASSSSITHQNVPIHKAAPPSSNETSTLTAGEAGTSVPHSGPAVVFRRNVIPENSRSYLTRELFELFLGDEVDEFMKSIDPGRRDLVSKQQFIKLVIDIYEYRKQLLCLIASQGGIRNAFRRMVAIFLTFIAVLIFLIVVGVSVNTIVISGAAALSSITVALSFLYSGFIQSVLFVCFLNPYNPGDRIRIDGALYVIRKISTYFTEVNDVWGKVVFFNHVVLYNMLIINESRSKHAGLEIPLVIAYDTPPSKYEALHKAVENYVQTTPELIKDSLALIINDVVVGHYIKFTYWCTAVDGWHSWKSVWTTRGKLMQYIVRQCKAFEITYKFPVQPLNMFGKNPIETMSDSNAGSGTSASQKLSAVNRSTHVHLAMVD